MTETYPLRLTRGTTGTVHAGREFQSEILDFNAPTVELRKTGKFETRIAKACGYDPNTLRRVSGVGCSDAGVAVTCKKCLKAIAG